MLNGLKLRGVMFEPVEFTPVRKPHLGRDPELSGQLCKGIFVKITDRNLVEPYRAGIELVWAFHQLHADKMVWDETVIERLTATTRLMKLIRDGKRPEEIFASWREEIDRFKERSRKYMLYK